MKTKSSKDNHNYSAQFMLAEYDRLQSLILDEIRQSEQRVNFFLTIASGAAGVIIIFSQVTALTVEIQLISIESILAVILLYGLITLNRLNSRVVQLNVYRRFQADIQKYFAERDPDIAKYVSVREDVYGSMKRGSLQAKIADWLRGTLQDLMILTNAVICGGMALIALLASGYTLQATVGWTVVTIIVISLLLRGYHYYVRDKLRPWL